MLALATTIKKVIGFLRKDIQSSFLSSGLCVFIAFFVISCLLSYCFNIYVFHDGEPFKVSLSGWITSSILTSLILMVCVKWRLIGYIFLPIIALIVAGGFDLHSVFDLFLSFSLSLFLSFSVFCCIAETDMREASDYISPLSITGVLMLVALSVICLHFAHKYVGKYIRYTHIFTSILPFILGTSIALQCTKKGDANYKNRDYFILARIWPFAEIRMARQHWADYKGIGGMELYRNIMKLPSMADASSSCSLANDDQLTLVLHIGESLRGDHINFNGYKRETMPLMSKRLKNLASFPKHYSYGLMTRISIIGMMTSAEVSKRETQHRPFVNLFKKHDYTSNFIRYTPSWEHDMPLYILASGCKDQSLARSDLKPTSCFFDQIVNVFKETQRQNHSFPKQLILLNDIGAHNNFRSLPQNKKWLPDEFPIHSPNKYATEVVNAYDNNIIEIDKELDSIIKELENQVAVYVYVADHGLALCEDGTWGRPCDERTFMPAFFIWMSDSFIKKYPAIHAALTQNASKTVSHDHLLHTILSLGGISSSLQKPELDLTNPQAKEYIPASNLEALMGIHLILPENEKVEQ